MQIAPDIADDAKRVLALHSAHILDTPPEEMFDRVTRLASRLLNAPISLISLIDADRQWFKSKVGVDATQTPRDISFCGHALLDEHPFVVCDTLEDPRFADNPWVIGPPHIRFYSGVPLRSVEGHAMGTLCVIDRVPRSLTETEQAVLTDLARIAEDLFQRRQLSFASDRVLESLRESEERYRQLVEHSPDAHLVTDGAVIEFINQAGLHLLGAAHGEPVIGRPIHDLLAPECRDIVGQRIDYALQTSRPNTPMELKWMRLDGTPVEVEVSSVSFTINGRNVIQFVARDNTQRKQYRDELEHLAMHDVLTGLPNRAVLRDRLAQGISRWARQQREATIAVLDLDHFKHINDILGHSVGDQVLAQISKVFLRSLRQNDTVARISGDEFVLILEAPEDEREAPEMVLERISKDVRQPLATAMHEVTVTCSIGFCRYPRDAVSVDGLLNSAYTAMYRAKNLGRSTISYYCPEMQSAASERSTMESRLRLALKQDEFVLHYQPKLDLKSGKMVGVEALVRWQHPEQGLISPARFIPVAEESGLIVPIGDWILRTACCQALVWQRMGIADMPVAVNLSARQFLQPNLVARVQSILETTGLAPHLLELELTESLSMDSPEKSVTILTALKALGVTLTLDDFGTGYSNLSYMKRFPLDKLKLDQSFVRDIAHSSEALAISQAVIALAHGLHLSVVAEGIETREQLALLREHRCDEIQGYYFSRPLPAEACTALLESDKRLD